MGWTDAFRYLRATARNGSAPQSAGLGWPLAARIGGVLCLPPPPLLHARRNGSLIVPPAAADSHILAMSRLRLNLAGSLYRYYLAPARVGDRETYLLVYCNGGGAVAEAMYCTRLARVVPRTAAEQAAYMGTAGVGLGALTYTLWRAQLGAYGLDEEALAPAFGVDEGIEYWRDAGDPEADFVPPFTGCETRLDVAAGGNGSYPPAPELHFMPYARALSGGGREYLLISTAVSGGGLHVDFVVGVPLAPDGIVIR